MGAGGIGRAFGAAPSFCWSLRAVLGEMAKTSPRQAICHSFIELSSRTVLLDFHGVSPFFQRLTAKDAHKCFGFGHESHEGIASRNHGADLWCRFLHCRGDPAPNLRNIWRRGRSRHGLPPQHETNEPRTGQCSTDLHEVPNGRASARGRVRLVISAIRASSSGLGVGRFSRDTSRSRSRSFTAHLQTLAQFFQRPAIPGRNRWQRLLDHRGDLSKCQPGVQMQLDDLA